jgi:hypothetical protein
MPSLPRPCAGIDPPSIAGASEGDEGDAGGALPVRAAGRLPENSMAGG